MGLSTTHLIIFLLIVIVIFGTKKLRNMGSDLGSAVKNFKDGMRSDAAAPPAELEKTTTPESTVVDVEAKKSQ